MPRLRSTRWRSAAHSSSASAWQPVPRSAADFKSAGPHIFGAHGPPDEIDPTYRLGEMRCSRSTRRCMPMITTSRAGLGSGISPVRPRRPARRWSAAMDAVGVDGALLVSPFTLYRYDASYALEVHAAHPDRFALIKPVDPNDTGSRTRSPTGPRPTARSASGLMLARRAGRSRRSRHEPGAGGGGAAWPAGEPPLLGRLDQGSRD